MAGCHEGSGPHASIERTHSQEGARRLKLRTYKAFTQAQALQAAWADFGPSVKVVHSRVVRRKGLTGFLHRRIIEVTVEIPQVEIAVSGGIQAAAIYSSPSSAGAWRPARACRPWAATVDPWTFDYTLAF